MAAEAAARNGSTENLRKTLKSVYPKAQFEREVEGMDDTQVIEQGKNLGRGVPMGTPVFDGAVEADVRSLLTQAGLSETGQEWLTDGRTGEGIR